MTVPLDDLTFYDDIEAYCGRLSCRAGESMPLHVSTRAERFRVRVERWGATREVVWESDGPIEGSFHPAPHHADSRGCGWPASLEIPTGTTWRSGFHLVTLTAEGAPEGRDVAHTGFVMRSTTPSSPILMVLGTNTWNAYNTWGGCSLYTGGHTVSFRRPFTRGLLCRPETERDDRKARPVRWDEEPDPDGEIYQEYRGARAYPAAIGSSGWFIHERRFVEWAERAGYRIDYAVSSDLDDDPTALDGYRLMLSVGHDEYWSAGQRAAVESHVAGGGHLASFSGNTMFWQVRLTAGGDAMVCHKYRAHLDDPVMDGGDQGLMSGMWADPVVGRPETGLLGAGSAWGLYHRFGRATARGIGGFVVYRDDHWMLAGTDLRYGDVLGARDGVVGYETLGCHLALDDEHLPVSTGRDGSPEDHTIVAMCPSSNLGVGDYPKSISALSDQGDLEFIAERIHGGVTETNKRRVRHGNAVIVETRPKGPDGGTVITVGTTDWAFGLGTDRAVERVTTNVLDRLMAG
ncbi:MAG: hypothetical protein RIR49_1072 [Actinomycetota bacterium]